MVASDSSIAEFGLYQFIEKRITLSGTHAA
jgi:hypothetical protein